MSSVGYGPAAEGRADMKRRLLNLLTALSLLLCVAVMAVWVRSYRVADVWERSSDRSYVAVETRAGEFRHGV